MGDDPANFGFKGTIPSSIGKLTALEVLELYTNHFTGTLPSELSACTKLELIDVEYNLGMTGEIPASYAALTNLNEVYVSNTGMSTGSVPEEFCRVVAPEFFVTNCAMECGCCSSCLPS